MSLKQVALHDKHVALGAKMVPFAGYEMPLKYTSETIEHKTVREGVGVFDVSHMGEFSIRGANAIDLVQWVTSNDVSRLVNGQAQYSCLPNLQGGIVDDLIVYRLAGDHFMLVVNASNIEKDLEWIQSNDNFGTIIQNRSDQTSLFAVQGPKAAAALQSLTDVDLSAIKYYHFEIGEIGGILDVLISATGYTGAGGFELYVENEHAPKLWDKLFEAGAEFDMAPIGLGARDTLRLEMGFALYGNDIDDSTSPLEAGLGWITKFNQEFINSTRLKAQKENGVKRKLVGFVMDERGIPRQGYEIRDDQGTSIGHVTSGTQSPMINKGIGMGYVDIKYAKPGTELFIAVRNKVLKATVTKPPFI